MSNKPSLRVCPETLGSAEFRADYGVRYAYLAGAMYKGIASKELVSAMGRAGLMAYLGTGGLDLQEIESAIGHIQEQLRNGGSYGMNLLSDPTRPQHEAALVEMYLRLGVRYVEASAFIQLTPSLVRYRLAGARRLQDGRTVVPNHILAKVSRPEVAEVFMRPPSPDIVAKLLGDGLLNVEEAAVASLIPLSNDICVEADSGGHTDQGVAYTLMPAITTLRDVVEREQGYSKRIRVGAAGGIGTPQAAAAAFVLGADFIMTGSINQCTIEAGTSEIVKDLLQDMNVYDTAYAPAGDMFELGAKVQVLKKGLFFPARANKLYELYMRHGALDEIDQKTARQIQEKYFGRSFEEVWAETCAYHGSRNRTTADFAKISPKQKMGLIFRWYFAHSTKLAMEGRAERKLDFQIQCGPALGAFNQWVRGSAHENWRQRSVAQIGKHLVEQTAEFLSDRLGKLADN